MLHRPPSSLSSFSSFDSFYSDRGCQTNFPIMAHGEAPMYLKKTTSGRSSSTTSFLQNSDVGTIGRAQKLALKAQKLSLSSIGSELSHSCSALYSMLTEGTQSNNQPVHYNPVRRVFIEILNYLCRYT